MPDKEVTFTLKKDDFGRLQKGVMTLNLPDIVKGDGKSITLVGTDKKNKSSNDYSISVGETSKTFTKHFLKQKTLKWFQMIMMLAYF